MKLTLIRYSSQAEDTLGLLFIEEKFACYTLEDEYRTTKVYGETRIPAGSYSITLRREGGFHDRYASRFPDIHQGMLHLQDVPGFEHILIHCGNRGDDTAGCILVGDTAQQNITEEGFIGNSTAAYRRIYPQIAAADSITIEIGDFG